MLFFFFFLSVSEGITWPATAQYSVNRVANTFAGKTHVKTVGPRRRRRKKNKERVPNKLLSAAARGERRGFSTTITMWNASHGTRSVGRTIARDATRTRTISIDRYSTYRIWVTQFLAFPVLRYTRLRQRVQYTKQ